MTQTCSRHAHLLWGFTSPCFYALREPDGKAVTSPLPAQVTQAAANLTFSRLTLLISGRGLAERQARRRSAAPGRGRHPPAWDSFYINPKPPPGICLRTENASESFPETEAFIGGRGLGALGIHAPFINYGPGARGGRDLPTITADAPSVEQPAPGTRLALPGGKWV